MNTGTNPIKRDGFVVALILFVVVMVAVVGAIAWVHYYYLPHMAAQNQATSTPVSAPTASSTLPTSSTLVAPSSPTENTQAKPDSGNCANNDLSCFISAAKICSPASVEWTESVNLFGFFIQTSQTLLSLKGLNSAGRCSFSDRVDNLTLSLTSSTEQAAEAKGITLTQLQQQLQASQTQARQQSVGATTACSLSTNTLVQILTRWSKGNFDSSDLASGSCTITMPNGSSTPLYTGGSIPLTPSKITVYLYQGETSGLNGVTFKVNSLTTTELNVTVTDQKTGASQTATLTVNNPMTIAGHSMTMTSIQQTNTGTINGQPSYSEQATVTY